MSESITCALILPIFLEMSSDVSKIIPRGGSSNPSNVGFLEWQTTHLYFMTLLIS